MRGHVPEVSGSERLASFSFSAAHHAFANYFLFSSVHRGSSFISFSLLGFQPNFDTNRP